MEVDSEGSSVHLVDFDEIGSSSAIMVDYEDLSSVETSANGITSSPLRTTFTGVLDAQHSTPSFEVNQRKRQLLQDFSTFYIAINP